MTQSTIDTSLQAPLPMVQLLQVLNLATNYFGRIPIENNSRAFEPEVATLPAGIQIETTQNWSDINNLTTSIYENEELNENGRNVLRAVKQGNLTLVREFLEKGANLRVSDEMGLSALHWAVTNDHIDITLVLLNHSADPNVRTTEIENTPLHRAARTGNLPACRYLLEYKADVNAINADGDMPLHVAARWGRKSVALLLLHNGAEVTVPNNWGRTPVQEAASNRRREVQKLLEEEEGRRNALSYNVTGNKELLPKWFLITGTNTSQAIEYIPKVPEVSTINTTIPITSTVSTTPVPTTPVPTVTITVSTQRFTTTMHQNISTPTTMGQLMSTTRT